MISVDYYLALGVLPDDELACIRRAYRMAVKLHADNPVRLVESAEAFSVLSDPDRRAAYDAERSAWPTQGPRDCPQVPPPVERAYARQRFGSHDFVTKEKQ